MAHTFDPSTWESHVFNPSTMEVGTGRDTDVLCGERNIKQEAAGAKAVSLRIHGGRILPTLL